MSEIMLAGYPASEWALGVTYLLAFTGLIQLMSSFALVKFVALQSPPIRRAFLTAASAYAVCVAVAVFGGPSEFALWAPLASLPVAPLVYWYWKRSFVKAWYVDPAMIPEGMTIANQDWRIGIYVLVGALAVAFIKKAPVVFAVQQGSGL